jgi:hypothetical protein
MTSHDTTELDALVAARDREIAGFRDQQEGVWSMVSLASLANRHLVVSAATCQHAKTAHPTDSHRLMMWYTLIDYQMDSFFLIVARRLGAGVALLRLASELARDVSRIGTSEDRLATWLERQSSRQARRKYRQDFVFDDSDHCEAYIHQLYELASNQGVHGHILDSGHSVPTSTSPDGAFFKLGIPDVAIYKTLAIWLAAAFPLNELCARTFPCFHGGDLTNAYAAFKDGRAAFDDAFQAYRQSLREMHADIVGSIH